MDKLGPSYGNHGIDPWELGDQLPLWVGIFSFPSLIEVVCHTPSRAPAHPGCKNPGNCQELLSEPSSQTWGDIPCPNELQVKKYRFGVVK